MLDVDKQAAHIPVLLQESMEFLNLENGEVFIDATFGGGGHSEAMLKHPKQVVVHAIDRDSCALQRAEALSNIYNGRLIFHHSVFSEIDSCVDHEVGGIIFDIGVSSTQIDSSNRGFSFLHDGELLMTMGRNEFTAAELVNSCSERELAYIIRQYGGEKRHKRIAHVICKERRKNAIKTTIKLASIVSDAVGGRGEYGGKIHPATRTFQALRIVVNNELMELYMGLWKACNILAVGGTLVVITFHSIEDFIVKNIFKILIRKDHVKTSKYPSLLVQDGDKFCRITKQLDIFDRYIENSDAIFNTCNLSGGGAWGNIGEKQFTIVGESITRPTSQELRTNRRARSAKLRAIRRAV